MTNEEKILEILVQMQANQDRMEAKLDQMGARQDRMEAKLDQMETRQGRMEARQDRMEARQDRMEEDLHRVKAYLELDVEKRFDAVNEGIDAILEKLVPEDRVEKLESEVVVLKTAVRTLARDVAELKKAQ